MLGIGNDIELSLVSAGSVSPGGGIGRSLKGREGLDLNIGINFFVIDGSEISREGSGNQQTKKDLGFHCLFYLTY